MGRALGLDEATLQDIPRWRESSRFDELDKLVLDLAEAMSQGHVEVPASLRDALLRHLTKGQLAELAAYIAWENHRARLNIALGVRAAGFSDGAFCLLPQP